MDDEYQYATGYLNEYESEAFKRAYMTRYEEYENWVTSRPLDAHQLYDFVLTHAGVDLDEDTLDDIVYKIWLSSPLI